MVPFLDDSALSKRRTDIWCTSADFLRLAAGDHEEHANLLAGYFLALGQQAYVVLGTSTMGASSAFVLTTGRRADDGRDAVESGEGAFTPAAMAARHRHDARHLRLWNPLTGHSAPVRDATGEMLAVGTVYSSDNVWANAQSSGQPWDLSWDLNGGGWRPLFGPALPPRHLASVQRAPLYEELEPLFYQELEARVEEAVRDALYRARTTVITQPNNKLSRLLKTLLSEVPDAMRKITAASHSASAAAAEGGGGTVGGAAAEADARATLLQERLHLMRGLQQSHNERVARETKTALVNGHILAMPYTDRCSDAIAEAVLNTGIHRCGDDRIKFSMAAHAEPMGAAFVCCIYVYVAAMRERV